MLNMIFFQPFMFGTALAEQMGFNLIDSGYHLIEFNQVDQTARIKVGNADRPDFSFVVHLFQLTPCRIVIAKGPVQQNKVEIAGFQFVQGCFHGFTGIFIRTEIHFRHEKQFLAGNTAFHDCASNGLLIPVCLRRINHAVAASDGSQNAFLTFGAAHQKCSEAEHRHLNVIVQSDPVHNRSSIYISALV